MRPARITLLAAPPRRFSRVAFAIALVLGACNESSGTQAPATGGSGGTSGAAGSGGSAGTGGSCDADYWECCDDPDLEPCRDLPEEECRARRYCFATMGAKLETYPHPDAGDFPECWKPEAFIGCASLCGRHGSPEPTCAYDPGEPKTCSCLPHETHFPDGWIEIFECRIPPGLCGFGGSGGASGSGGLGGDGGMAGEGGEGQFTSTTCIQG